VKKTLRLNAITAMISDQGNAGHDPKTTQKTNCPNQISTKDWTTSETRPYCFAEGNRFSYLPCLKTACANQDPPNGSVRKADFNPLKIGHESAPGDAGSFFANTACFFGKTPGGNGAANDWLFVANGTMSHRGTDYIREFQLGKVFFLLYTPFPLQQNHGG
jgi:hypothetical protein